ncbi:MAG: transcription termination factor NusA [Candidatus Omnitrophica bacterium]|nr:transcription termination factor NusA [Candidatus Omnitrophota bacterium]
MANDELLSILDYIERERGIDREVLFKSLESALVSAARKIVGKQIEDIVVSIDRTTGEISVKAEGKEVKSDEFGRIAAQTAKQVIIQKLREAERDVIYDDFQAKVGTIVSGAVHRFERGDIIIDLGKTEAILPKNQQAPNERYKQGERLRAYVLEVNKGQKGPQIIMSRTNPGLIKKMFELEVPEISEGIVEVRGISREPGERTKIAVYSKEEKIDPVGACVGVRGQRVKGIVNDLHNERIDIIRYSDDIKEYVKSALSPAEVSSISADREAHRLEVVVEDDQLSLAIGKHGQNVRLASRLVGWEIDVRSRSQINERKKPVEEPSAEEVEKDQRSIETLEGVGKKTREILFKAGFDTVDKIKNATVDDLVKLEGIGKKTAEKIIKSAKETE